MIALIAGGALLLGGLLGLALGWGGPQRIDKRRMRWRQHAMDEFTATIGGVVYGPADVHRLPYGIVPPAPANPPFDEARAYWYRGHHVLTLNRALSLAEADGLPRPDECTFAEVRTTHVPRLQLSGRAFPEYHPDNSAGLIEIILGHEQFDAAFRVRTEDEAFARRVLSSPVLDFLVADGRYHQARVTFEGGVAWTAVPARATPHVFAIGLDLVVDLVDRLPADVRPTEHPGSPHV